MNTIISLVAVFEFTDFGEVPVVYSTEVADDARDAVGVLATAILAAIGQAAHVAAAVVADSKLRGDSQLGRLGIFPGLTD